MYQCVGVGVLTCMSALLLTTFVLSLRRWPKLIKDQMDKKLGAPWHVVVGSE